MLKPEFPVCEETRLETLLSFEVLDTPSESPFDDMVHLASLISGCPVAFVSLVDKDRQWFKAKKGLDVEQTPREISFCGHAILNDKVMVVPDTLKDERFCDNPLVVQGPKVRFYAGAPLIAVNGMNVGTLCVIDLNPREFTEEQKESLEALARQVILLLTHRSATRLLERSLERLNEQDSVLTEMTRLASVAEMSGSIAHEINNPLTIVLSKAHQLKSLVEAGHSDPAEQLKIINTIAATGDRMAKIIKGMLRVVRDGKKDPLESICLQTVLEEVAALAADKFKFAGIKLTLPEFPHQVFVNAKATPLAQVLLNLLNNSFDAVQNLDTRWVRLNFTEMNDKILVSITDSGNGIDPEIRSKIMQPFFSTKTAGKGSGLGLSVSKRILESFGGRIELNSKYEHTTFDITLLSVKKLNA